MKVRRTLDLGVPPPIPERAHQRVCDLLASGRLHRYREGVTAPGAAARLEMAFAELIGTRYAVSVNSCGSSLYLALICSGVASGDPVLMGAFTLAPVLGAIANAGGRPVPVEITDDLVIDFDDLEAKAKASGARHLLVSHMRGHVCDLAELTRICERLDLVLIEDCAHTLGATWSSRPTGSFGKIGCFSFQSAKHINAGEGEILVTDSPEIAARAILHSGSYMLYRQNGTCPPDDIMDVWRDRCANYSLRLSELAAELALAQLEEIPTRARDWNFSHDRIAAGLSSIEGVVLPYRPPAEAYVQSSLQFRLPDFSADQMTKIVAACRDQGVYVKWFGIAEAEGYTSAPRHWSALPGSPEAKRTQAILNTLCDFRLPLGLTSGDCDQIVSAIASAYAAAASKVSA